MNLDYLPQPLNLEKYIKYKSEIYDSTEVDVFINDKRDFAFLSPMLEVDYNNYIPRVKKLGLRKYSLVHDHLNRRYNKIKDFFYDKKNMLEIGASDGSFLKIIKENHKDIICSSCEPDQSTLIQRQKYSDYDFANLEQIIDKNMHFEIIVLSHVFEHIQAPIKFLNDIKKLMNENSLIIIEVPSLNDPLISLYNNKNYESFYFNIQHPFIYSNNSLDRVLVHNQFKSVSIISHQRYGLENHLQWLSNGNPGGNPDYHPFTNNLEQGYIKNLEKINKSDSVIWVGKKC